MVENVERLSRLSKDGVASNIDKIAELFPQVVTEGIGITGG